MIKAQIPVVFVLFCSSQIQARLRFGANKKAPDAQQRFELNSLHGAHFGTRSNPKKINLSFFTNKKAPDAQQRFVRNSLHGLVWNAQQSKKINLSIFTNKKAPLFLAPKNFLIALC